MGGSQPQQRSWSARRARQSRLGITAVGKHEAFDRPTEAAGERDFCDVDLGRKIGFGLIYSDNGNAYSDAYRTDTGGGLGGETTLELDYQYNPAPWLSIQPDAQYILDPGGDSSRGDILVLGLRTIVRF